MTVCVYGYVTMSDCVCVCVCVCVNVSRRDDVSSRTDILISVREVIIGSKIGLTILFVFLKTYVLMRILITNDLQKTATLYRLCRQRLANRREFFHTFEMSCNPKDHRAVVCAIETIMQLLIIGGHTTYMTMTVCVCVYVCLTVPRYVGV